MVIRTCVRVKLRAWFPRGQVEHMIADGTMTDATSAAAYALLLLRDVS
jgi:hypothetical protein